jgi:large subunit ribosomal protein L23
MVLKPRMSEKTYAQSGQSVFIFDVPKDSNKHEIAQAVAKTYDVTVTAVRTVIVKGKEKRLYRNRRSETGVRNDVKKAYVTLQKGQSIPIFAAVEEAEEKEEKLTKKLEKQAEKKAKKESKEK